MRMRKRTLALILVLLLAALPMLPDRPGTRASAASETPVEITYVYPGFHQRDEALVLAKINAVLKARTGATLKLEPIDWGSYSDRVNLLLAAREPVDLVFTAGWFGFDRDLKLGGYQPLDDLLAKDAPELKATISPAYLKAASRDGKLYGIPAQTLEAPAHGVLLNKKLVEKYGIDTGKIRSLSDLTPILKRVAPKGRSQTVIGTAGDFAAFAVKEPIGFIPGSLVDGSGTKVVNEYDTPAMKAQLGLFYSWYKSGYMRSVMPYSGLSSLTDAERSRVLAVLQPSMTFKSASGLAETTGIEWVAVPLGKPYLSGSRLTSAMTAIPAASEHPDKAMQVLNLLHTDKTLVNLLYWGIENRHYVRADAAGLQLKFAENAYNYGPSLQWMIGNPGIGLHPAFEAPYGWAKAKTMFASAERSPLLGFGYDEGDGKLQEAASAVVQSFANSLNRQPSDPAIALHKLLADLKKAGADKLIAEKQKQVQAFLNAG